MTPAQLDLTIYQGATFRKSFTWQTGDPLTAVDLTGCTMRMQIRERRDATEVIVELTSENGGITITPLTGQFALYLSATATAALAVTKAVYDLEIVFANGDVVRFLQGKVTVSPEVTR